MDRKRQLLTILLLGLTVTVFGAVVPSNPRELDLKAGWNLVALKGKPLIPQELLSLRALVLDSSSQSFIRYDATMELQRGKAVSLYSETEHSITLTLVSTAEELPEALPSADLEWNMIGATSAAPSWLEDVVQPFVRWDAPKGFVPANEPGAGQGYWVQMK